MDIISGLVFLFLFLIMMLIVFSMGLTSPYLGKKEISYILIIGFILGGIGGYFFVEPIYEETPYIIGTFSELFSNDDDCINIILPSSSNISKISSDILNLDGVNSVSTNGFDLKTEIFTNSQQENIEIHLDSIDEIDSYKINNSYISVNLTENAYSTSTLGNLVNWLTNNSISSEFAFIHLQIKLKHSSVNSVLEYLKNKHYTIDSVEGPVQDTITKMSNGLLNKWIIVVISGIIGIGFAVLGIYADNISSFIRKRKN